MSICRPCPPAATRKAPHVATWDAAAGPTGRKLVRVRAAQFQETVWETVVPGRTAESLSVLQEALTQAEHLLGLAGDDEHCQARRARVELRVDSGWGTTPIIEWLLSRGYQITGKF